MHRTHDHPRQSEQVQDIHDLAGNHIFPSKHPVKYLNQQEYIPLGYQTGQDGAGRGRGIAIGVRNPVMERIQSAFNGKANTDDSKDDQHGNPIYAGRLNQRHSLLGRTHKQVSGHIIEQAQANQEQARPQLAHDHIPYGR